MTATVRVNPKLISELQSYGAEDVQNCYHCGNCSAACPYSSEPFILPRMSTRLLQMGLEESLRGNLEPWLCYYCGQCSDQCPRDAEPGATMMSLRRWLTGRYDFTGIARRFYRSWKIELAALIIVALLTGAGLLAYGFLWGGGNLSVFDTGGGQSAFLPAGAIHVVDWVLGLMFITVVLVNMARMWHFTMHAEDIPRASAGAYLRHALLFPLHFFTQKRWAKCDNNMPWLTHLPLMLGYLTMLVLIMFFLEPFQDGPAIDWKLHTLGYLATAGLLVGVWYAVRGRLKKNVPMYRHSHSTDWVFVLLLLAIVATGVLLHVLHRLGFGAAANLTYVAHMMVVVPWMMRFPFSKWSHMMYRPLAMYFAAIQTEALASQSPQLQGGAEDELAPVAEAA